ncbi:MAG: hypothetical protein JNM57_08790 [Cyclobacteriaceae bacterium]|nr:hypothetical protein [Cyclobacteriaceae bacterium]
MENKVKDLLLRIHSHVKRARLLVLLSVLLLSCNFQPEGEIFTKVTPPSTTGLFINLENDTDQIIQLKEKTTFAYTIETDGKPLLESRVLLNGNVIWVSSLLSSAFDLDPALLNSGSYTLKIEFRVKSESGSIADEAGAEYIVVWKQKTIVVDHNIPTTPDDPNAIAISRIENADGILMIYWNQYNNFNFQYYELVREDYDDKGNYISGYIFPLYTESSQTSAIDFMYVGGKSIYKLKLHAANQVYSSPDKEYEHPYKPEISYKIESSGQVSVSWNSLHSLRNNFYQYKLELSETSGWAETVSFDLFNISDTSITYTPSNFKFGSQLNVTLSLIPSEYSSYYKKVHKTQLKYGNDFPTFEPYNFSLQFYATDKNFYFLKNFHLHKTNTAGETLDSLENYYDKIVINNNYLGVGYRNNKNYLLDLQTMTEVEELVLPSENNGVVFSISDNSKLAIEANTGIKIISLSGEEILATPYHINGFAGISPGAKYLMIDPVYRFDGSQYEIWTSLNSHYIKSIDFLPDEPSKVILGYYDKVGKYDLETKTVLLESFDYKGPCNYDPVTKKLGCLTSNQFVVLDPDTFEVYKSLDVDPSVGLFYLFNETIICSSGVQIKLSDIP